MTMAAKSHPAQELFAAAWDVLTALAGLIVQLASIVFALVATANLFAQLVFGAAFIPWTPFTQAAVIDLAAYCFFEIVRNERLWRHRQEQMASLQALIVKRDAEMPQQIRALVQDARKRGML